MRAHTPMTKTSTLPNSCPTKSPYAAQHGAARTFSGSHAPVHACGEGHPHTFREHAHPQQPSLHETPTPTLNHAPTRQCINTGSRAHFFWIHSVHECGEGHRHTFLEYAHTQTRTLTHPTGPNRAYTDTQPKHACSQTLIPNIYLTSSGARAHFPDPRAVHECGEGHPLRAPRAPVPQRHGCRVPLRVHRGWHVRHPRKKKGIRPFLACFAPPPLLPSCLVPPFRSLPCLLSFVGRRKIPPPKKKNLRAFTHTS